MRAFTKLKNKQDTMQREWEQPHKVDILLSWQDMCKPCWGLLPVDFPKLIDKEEQFNRVEGKKDKEANKFSD